MFYMLNCFPVIFPYCFMNQIDALSVKRAHMLLICSVEMCRSKTLYACRKQCMCNV